VTTRSAFRPIVFTLNGARASVRAHPMARLLDVLRESCGLTGTKEGCGEGECGACTVLVDGRAVNSCLVPVAHVAGRKVLTIEGLKGRHPLQRAFAEYGGTQCGFCTPGMILAAVALGPHPTLEDVRRGLAGNICRCTGYEGIYRAILKSGGASRASDSGTRNAGSPRQEKTSHAKGEARSRVPRPASCSRRRSRPAGRLAKAGVPPRRRRRT